MDGSRSGGSLIEGFHSLEVLRRSANATVYRAVPDDGGDPVVLKVARTGGSARPEVPDDVPGAVRVLAEGSTRSGRPFVAMVLYGDGDYADVLRRRHPLPLSEVARVGESVAGALGALHAAGLAHHAVEPSHVLLGDEGVALTGLDRVRPMGAPGAASDAAALPYTPPEVIEGRAPTPASDVYRLAATLWELLAGRPPFTDGPTDLFALRERVLGAVLPPPREDLPGAWWAVLSRALEKDPGLRHPDTAAFAADLETATVAVPSAPAPVTEAPSGRETPAGHPPSAGPAPETAMTETPVGPPAPRTEPPVRPAPRPSFPESTAVPAPDGPAPRDPRHGVGERTAPASPDSSGTNATPPAPSGTGPDTGDPRPGTTGPTAPGPPGATASPLVGPRRDGAVPADPWHGIVDHTGTASPPTWTDAAPRTGPRQSGGVPRDPRHDPRRTPAVPAPLDPPRRPEPWRPAADAPHERADGSAPRWGAVRIAVASAAVVVIVLGVVTFLNPGPVASLLGAVGLMSREEPPAPEGGLPEASDVPNAAIDPEAAPTGVTLEDSGDSVVLTWTTAEGAESAPHHVVGGPSGDTPASLAEAAAGTAEARVEGLDPEAEYCFIVIALLGGDTIAHSEEACTDRGAG
ncbi:protein kinase [Nocardiopsis sp. N85]|uniref:serine/threonine protein kinase n=1 Tax=Nocardiopsis sp. N85 TaxID=3029400 RepID=UPI00237FCABF|nr:protein kinase [Nocardiopsis sp. N85]MDE3723148.1 protein kinase [Nocardiopsis sp. N85]